MDARLDRIAHADPAALLGLSSEQAAAQTAKFGANAVADEYVPPLQRLLRHFWAPVPWMLEATIVLQLALRQWLTAALVAGLLLFNVVLGAFQEGKANAALALLKRRLTLMSRVKRDGVWVDLPAARLVPGDIVQISLGDVVPADLALLQGSLQVDQSMLTGESMPVDLESGGEAYAGALVRRGDAVGRVLATGARTYFGRTAELVTTAHVISGEQKAVLAVVRNLTIINFAIASGIVAYALAIGTSLREILLLVLTVLLSAVPVALPATFTLAAALGARTLAMKGVLLTRLSALNEAAMIDVLCCDKTGTLTKNELAISAIRPLQEGFKQEDVLAYAALASSVEGQDPIDTAVRSLARTTKSAVTDRLKLARFTPFDPAAKLAEAVVADGARELRIVKGAPTIIATVAPMSAAAKSELDALTQAGSRVIAVAAGPVAAMSLVGFIGFSDPPRTDSAALLSELKTLGVQTVMVTGDSPATAATIAREIGLMGPVFPPGPIPDDVGPSDFSIFGGVFPEQKFQLVKAFQRGDHTVGMCGDGSNDAPALRQAQMGIAVSTATDVAKAAAGVVLTEPGLGGIVACIKEGRSAFQRVLTYTLTLLINKCVTLFVLGAGLIVTGHAVLTPLLQALMILTSDFVTMARTADRASPTDYPNAWRVRNLTLAAVPLGAFRLLYLIALLALGAFWLKLGSGQMQTLTFTMLAFAAQGNLYVLRTHGPFWRSRPAPIIPLASLGAMAAVAGLALGGILMSPLPPWIVGALLAATVVFTFSMDAIKLIVFSRIRID